MSAAENQNLEAVKPAIKSGSEPFTTHGGKLAFTLEDFWSWGFSDLLHNVTRGCLAEFVVARALGATNDVRNPWAAYDLDMPMKSEKLLKVEVKSAAYLQSWSQDRFSTIQFDVRPTKTLNLNTSKYDGLPIRHADVYVFALLKEKNKATVNPLSTEQWVFYVLPTSRLNNRTRSQSSITFNSFEDEMKVKAVTYAELKQEVLKAAAEAEVGSERTRS